MTTEITNNNTSLQPVFMGWALFFGSFFGSFVGGGYMLYKNYCALGQQEKARNTVYLYAALMIALSLTVYAMETFLNTEHNIGYISVIIVLGHYFAEQRKQIQNTSLKRSSFLRSFVTCFISFTAVICIGILFSLTVSRESYDSQWYNSDIAQEETFDQKVVTVASFISAEYQTELTKTGQYPIDLRFSSATDTDRAFEFVFMDNAGKRDAFCFFHTLDEHEQGRVYVVNQNSTGYFDSAPKTLAECEQYFIK